MTETKGRKCRGKKRHGTRKEALAHLRRLIRKGAWAAWLNVYRCEHCNQGWHVGHKPGRRKS